MEKEKEESNSSTLIMTRIFSISEFPKNGIDSGDNSDEMWNYHVDTEFLGFGVPNTPGANRIIHFALGTLLILIGIAGASGNGLVLYVFTRYRRLRGGGGPLILSLACGDFIVSILHILPAYSSFNQKWSFGKIGCELYAGSVGLGGMASLLTLSVIAADRFSVIMGYPLPFISTKKTCVLIWMFCLSLTLPPFFGWSRYNLEGLGTSCSWDYTTRTLSNRLYYIFLLFFGFVIPVTLIIISYVGILRVVCKQSNTMSGVSRNGVCRKGPTKSDIKTAKVILSIIICFLTSWSPYAVISIIGQFGDVKLLSPLATALPAVFAKASVIYNPFVYGLSHPHFRSAIRMLRARYFPSKTNNNVNISPVFNPNMIRNDAKIREKKFCNNKLEIKRDFTSEASKAVENSHGEKMRLHCRESDNSGHTLRTTLPFYCDNSKGEEATANSEPDLLSTVLSTRESLPLRKCHYNHRELFRSEFCLEKFATDQPNKNYKTHHVKNSYSQGGERPKVNLAVVKKRNNKTSHVVICEGQNRKWEMFKIFGRRHTTFNIVTSPWGDADGKFAFDFSDNCNNLSVYESCEEDCRNYNRDYENAYQKNDTASFYSSEEFHSVNN